MRGIHCAFCSLACAGIATQCSSLCALQLIRLFVAPHCILTKLLLTKSRFSQDCKILGVGKLTDSRKYSLRLVLQCKSVERHVLLRRLCFWSRSTAPDDGRMTAQYPSCSGEYTIVPMWHERWHCPQHATLAIRYLLWIPSCCSWEYFLVWRACIPCPDRVEGRVSSCWGYSSSAKTLQSSDPTCFPWT